MFLLISAPPGLVVLPFKVFPNKAIFLYIYLYIIKEIYIHFYTLKNIILYYIYLINTKLYDFITTIYNNYLNFLCLNHHFYIK